MCAYLQHVRVVVWVAELRVGHRRLRLFRLRPFLNCLRPLFSLWIKFDCREWGGG